MRDSKIKRTTWQAVRLDRNKDGSVAIHLKAVGSNTRMQIVIPPDGAARLYSYGRAVSMKPERRVRVEAFAHSLNAWEALTGGDVAGFDSSIVV